MLINYFLLFLALLMLIFAAVAILYVGPKGDIFVYPTIFFLEHTKTVYLISYATVEPQYSETLYYEVLGITNDFPCHSNSKINEKEPRYNKTLL